MNLATATKMALVYYSASVDVMKTYIEAIEKFNKSTDLSNCISIRFLAPGGSAHSIERTATDFYNFAAAPSSMFCVYRYRVREDKRDRFAFVGSDFEKEFSVRYFTDKSKFNRFKGNHKIEILDEFDYQGAAFIKYHSEGSNVDRVAVYAPVDLDITYDSFVKQFTHEGSIDADRTKVFG